MLCIYRSNFAICLLLCFGKIHFVLLDVLKMEKLISELITILLMQLQNPVLLIIILMLPKWLLEVLNFLLSAHRGLVGFLAFPGSGSARGHSVVSTRTSHFTCQYIAGVP